MPPYLFYNLIVFAIAIEKFQKYPVFIAFGAWIEDDKLFAEQVLINNAEAKDLELELYIETDKQGNIVIENDLVGKGRYVEASFVIISGHGKGQEN